MRVQLFAFAAVFASFTALAGCAADTQAPDLEDESGESEEALVANGNTGFFIVTHRDFRRCVSPLCGGVWVKRVNESRTYCGNGTYGAECYVAATDLVPTGLDAAERDAFLAKFESGTALVRGTMRSMSFNGTRLGKLRAIEAWAGVGAEASVVDSTFFRTADNGIRCIKAPCPSLTAYTLNSRDSHNIIRVDLDGVAADPSELDAASTALGTREGILVAGGLALPKCLPNTNCGPFVTAQEFYLRQTHKVSTVGQTCGTRGAAPCGAGEFCSFPASAQCGATDRPGTCAVRPEACIALYQPVCGCDGRTYGNACSAASSGVSVASNGACVAR